jgi:hypothetical protein
MHSTNLVSAGLVFFAWQGQIENNIILSFYPPSYKAATSSRSIRISNTPALHPEDLAAFQQVFLQHGMEAFF